MRFFGERHTVKSKKPTANKWNGVDMENTNK